MRGKGAVSLDLMVIFLEWTLALSVPTGLVTARSYLDVSRIIPWDFPGCKASKEG